MVGPWRPNTATNKGISVVVIVLLRITVNKITVIQVENDTDLSLGGHCRRWCQFISEQECSRELSVLREV
jgi:hypothetical protein